MTGDRFKLDTDRIERLGIEEAILCEGKSDEDLIAILRSVEAAGRRALFTRLPAARAARLDREVDGELDYDRRSSTAWLGTPPTDDRPPRVAVVSAGTSDLAVAGEAARTLAYHGYSAARIDDIGVAGLWRLYERREELARYPVLIVVAGMDAALPSVIAGLYGGSVIGVPTSTGYGAARGGRTALYAQLASCAPGLVVVNIDNGFGAGCAALRILGLLGRGAGA